MNLKQHISVQDPAILLAIEAAAEKGAEGEPLMRLYATLKEALETLDDIAPQTINIISSGYLSAFADAEGEWDYHIERGTMAMKAIEPMLEGKLPALLSVMERFAALRSTNLPAARIFGFGLTRLHPMTMHLAENAGY